MDSDKLPAPTGGNPPDLTKKELVAHLVDQGAARWKLEVMTREGIIALFEMTAADALAAVDAAGKAHSRKYRHTAVDAATAVQAEAVVFAREQSPVEHLLTGEVRL